MANTTDVMAAAMNQLTASASVCAAFGRTSTVEKFYADQVNFTADLPYLHYLEDPEIIEWLFTGYGVGRGSFEIRVSDTTKLGCRQKLEMVVKAIREITLPLTLSSGDTIVYMRNRDNIGRDLGQVSAPGADVTIFGRSSTILYRVSRQST